MAKVIGLVRRSPLEFVEVEEEEVLPLGRQAGGPVFRELGKSGGGGRGVPVELPFEEPESYLVVEESESGNPARFRLADLGVSQAEARSKRGPVIPFYRDISEDGVEIIGPEFSVLEGPRPAIISAAGSGLTVQEFSVSREVLFGGAWFPIGGK